MTYTVFLIIETTFQVEEEVKVYIRGPVYVLMCIVVNTTSLYKSYNQLTERRIIKESKV